jgi:hypothetical protein
MNSKGDVIKEETDSTTPSKYVLAPLLNSYSTLK